MSWFIVVRVSTEKRRVLVVDEDPLRRLALDRQLEVLGWESYGAGDGGDALGMLERGPRFEAMFIDVHVSDVNARELAATAAQRLPHLWIRFTATRSDWKRRLVPLLLLPLTIESLARTLGTAVPRWAGDGVPVSRSGYPR